MNNIDRQYICDYERVDIWYNWIFDPERSPEHRAGLLKVWEKTASPHMKQIAERAFLWDNHCQMFWSQWCN